MFFLIFGNANIWLFSRPKKYIQNIFLKKWIGYDLLVCILVKTTTFVPIDWYIDCLCK